MAGILDQLPNPSQLDDLKKTVVVDPDAMGFGGLKDINIAGMTSSIKGIGGEGIGSFSTPELPATLTKDGFTKTLSQPVDKLKTFDTKAVLGNVSSGQLPIQMPTPSFDLNTPISAITSKVMPAAPTNISVPNINTGNTGMDFSGMVTPLRKLANAGAATPTRLLYMMLNVGKSFVTTITDTDQLIKLTVQSLDEIYTQQILALQGEIPFYAIDNAAHLYGTVGLTSSFTARYRLLLDEIETLGPKDVDRLKKILSDAQTTTIPALRSFGQTRHVMDAFAANDVKILTTRLNNVLNLTGTGEVYLQAYFDSIGKSTHDMLGSISKPVTEIGNMAGKISDFMNETAAKAEEAASAVQGQIETNLKTVEDVLKDVQKTLEDLEDEIKVFVEKLDVGPLVNKAKIGLGKIAAAVENFFQQVEELKRKLGEMVKKIAAQVDEKLTAAFKAAEEKIRDLLGKITDVLERPEVKDALEQARQGIESFKTTIEQASLKPVFDLVIDKTSTLEGSIKRLNVTQMSTPQKVALKVGSKIIQQVKVDEVIKPELMDAFEQIRAPLAELITLLKEKALEIEKVIYEFDPGTVVNNFIINSDPYKQLMALLDEFRPSKLLAPLKEANAYLTDLVKQLDPNILIDAVQKIYDKLAGLVDFINPAPLNRMIGDAVDVAVSTLGHIRDQELDKIIQTIKDTISLTKLMEQSGLKEIANADFWTMLNDTLGGAYLDQISAALTEVETKLATLAATLDFGRTQKALKDTVTSIDQQIAIDSTFLVRRATELHSALKKEAQAIAALETRRQAILKKTPVFPEITGLLGELDLTPIIQLEPAVNAVIAMNATSEKTALAAVKAVLQPNVETLRQMSSATFQDAAVVIFRKQIGDPINALIAQIKEDLKPFTTALKKIKGILDTLLEIPPKIDAAVAKVLDSARDSIKKVITGVIDTIQTLQKALTNTLTLIYESIKKTVSDLSPYWILNSFARSDFAGDKDGDDWTPPGMMAMAKRIVSGIDSSGLKIAALLKTKLSDDQLGRLNDEASAKATTLEEGNRTNVLTALNAALRDRNLCTRENVDALKASLDKLITDLAAKIKANPEASDISKSYRYSALRRQLSDAWVNYNSGENKDNAMIRLNRVVLEAAYPEDVSMSLQSLHPFIVENVAHLYPEQLVQDLDDIYIGVIEKVKTLPDLLIRAPLDDAFNKIKAILKANFDISGIFAVLEIKMDGLDEDLSQGLDRLSLTYNHLLTTFDKTLSAA